MNERVRLTRKTFGRILRGNFMILEVKRKSGINMIYSWPESGQTWAHSINCQTSCDGIYADGEQQKDENFQDMTKHLMEHYEIFKRKNVGHFRFNSAANANMFGM